MERFKSSGKEDSRISYNRWEETHGAEASEEVGQAECSNEKEAAEQENIWNIPDDLVIVASWTLWFPAIVFTLLLCQASNTNGDFSCESDAIFW